MGIAIAFPILHNFSFLYLGRLSRRERFLVSVKVHARGAIGVHKNKKIIVIKKLDFSVLIAPQNDA